VSPRWSDG